jgi:hypothetical protein
MWFNFALLTVAALCICSCCFISFYIPWVLPKVTIKQGLFDISVPIELGLLKCYSDVCKDFSQIVKFIDEKHHREDKSTSTEDHEDSDNLESNWSIKMPKQLRPEVDSLKETILTAEKPFREASLYTIPLVVLSFLTSLAALMLCFYLLVLGCDTPLTYFKVRYAIVTLLSSVLLLLLSSMTYIFKTVVYLHGGSYGDAIWLNLYFVIFSLICILYPVNFFWSRDEHYSNQYTTIPDSEAPDFNSLRTSNSVGKSVSIV